MIKSWKHKGLRNYFDTGSKAGIITAHEKRIKYILFRLNAAIKLDDMRTPSMRLHKLAGNLEDYYAVTVNANWRIIFKFDGTDFFDIDYLDYH